MIGEDPDQPDDPVRHRTGFQIQVIARGNILSLPLLPALP